MSATDGTLDDVADTAWIADATRRLAGLGGGGEMSVPDPRWSGGTDTLDRLRASIGSAIAALPRQGRPLGTAAAGVTISHLALAKALAAHLAEPAAAAAAAVGDVEVSVEGDAVGAVHVRLVAVGADERDASYLDDGDVLRSRAARFVAELLGVHPPRVDLTWQDVLLPPA
ncbi:hypothetical protein P0W64_18990 [Tsukamurella sp. 8F]|uniref:hypothetical protein n=1 Tax=unclassified Tsukamurella TaxID=2633480 RepID=UPI0023B8A6A9|nr:MULTISPECIES: hypothetical protein [unclassified Tsukamurella]MDF0531972.1 hypothetical protein [Tsukamurella sp. 8J]MDF0588871.1 hypothetical protein [Tsukamurella sp. 8F]